MSDDPSRFRMENLSYHDAPKIERVLAPYAGQFIAVVQGQAKQIPENIKNDPALLNEFFQKFQDVAHELQRDGEFAHSDLLQVRDAIEGLRQQAVERVRNDLAALVPEAA